MRVSRFVKGGLAASVLLTLGAAAAPGIASAQGHYDQYGRWQDDNCAGSTAGGAVVGGVAGAVAGSQLAARGHRSDGSLVGGLLGAAVGAAVGNNAGCNRAPPPPPPPPPPSAYIPPDNGYANVPPPQQQGYGDQDYAPRGQDGYRPPADYNPQGGPPSGYGQQPQGYNQGYSQGAPQGYAQGSQPYDQGYDEQDGAPPPPPPGGYYADYGPDAPSPPPPPSGYVLGPAYYGAPSAGVLVLGGPRYRYFYYPRHYRWDRRGW